MLSGVAKFTTIITIMVVTCECLEAARDTIDNGSLGVGSKTPKPSQTVNQKLMQFCFKNYQAHLLYTSHVTVLVNMRRTCTQQKSSKPLIHKGSHHTSQS